MDKNDDYHFEYKLEYPNENNIYKNGFSKKYSQGHYIYLAQNEMSRSKTMCTEKEMYTNTSINNSKLNKICQCIIC